MQDTCYDDEQSNLNCGESELNNETRNVNVAIMSYLTAFWRNSEV